MYINYNGSSIYTTTCLRSFDGKHRRNDNSGKWPIKVNLDNIHKFASLFQS